MGNMYKGAHNHVVMLAKLAKCSTKLLMAYSGCIRHGVSISLWEFMWVLGVS